MFASKVARSCRLMTPAVSLHDRSKICSAQQLRYPKQAIRLFSKEPKPKLQNDKTFIQKFLGPKPMPERGTAAWYREMVLICTVFAITGSSTMVMVRPAVRDVLGIKGTMIEGPWSYRICSILIMTPIYATLLVCVGTIFGRHSYFRHFAVKLFSRFGIPPELIDKNYHTTKQHFRKW